MNFNYKNLIQRLDRIQPNFWLPYFPIVLAPLILFSPIWLTGKTMFWGTPSLQFVPWWTWAWDTLLDGHLPLWNPLVGMGAPLMANYQSALFYPPTWIYFLLYLGGGLTTMVWGQALLTAFHLIWAGIGMARLSARLELGKLAQTVSGLAFSLSGYLVARAWFASINMAVAWLPWILLFSYDALQSKSRFRWIKLSIVIGLQLLAGHAQTTWYTLTLAGMWVGFWGWQNAKGKDAHGHTMIDRWSWIITFLQAEIRFAISALFGAFLAAVQLLPTAVYLNQSQRANAVAYDAVMAYSFWPWRLLSLFAPDFFGNPVRGDYWGYANYWEDANYIGVLPLLLAISVMWRAIYCAQFNPIDYVSRPLKRSWRSVILFLTAVLSISLLLALGDNTVIFPWLYRNIPTFDMFKAPTRIAIWAQFSLALLAGIGVAGWRRPRKRVLFWTRLSTMGGFAIALGSGLAWILLGDIKATFVRAAVLAGFWGLGSGILSLTAPEAQKSNGAQRWTFAVVILIVADLLIAGWGLSPSIARDYYTDSESGVRGRVYISSVDERTIKRDNFLRFDSFGLDLNWDLFQVAMLPNANMLVGVSSVNNYDPFVPGRYARWMESLENLNNFQFEQLLDLMGVSVIEQVYEVRELGVEYVNRGNQKLFRWVPCSIFVDSGDAAWEQVFSEQINFDEKVVLEGESFSSSSSLDCSSVGGVVKLESSHPNEKIIQIKSDQSGWVVISDVWYPGWKAWVDGLPVPVLRANYLFRAIEVDQGEHQVVMQYLPMEFYLGCLLSLVSWFYVLYFYRLNI